MAGAAPWSTAQSAPLIALSNIDAEDMAYTEEKGGNSCPNAPREPDPPRYDDQRADQVRPVPRPAVQQHRTRPGSRPGPLVGQAERVNRFVLAHEHRYLYCWLNSAA